MCGGTEAAEVKAGMGNNGIARQGDNGADSAGFDVIKPFAEDRRIQKIVSQVPAVIRGDALVEIDQKLLVGFLQGPNDRLLTGLEHEFLGISQRMFSLFFRFPHNLRKHIHIPGAGIGNILSELDKIDGVFPGQLAGIEGTETEKRFAAHVCGQPMPVAVFADIPEVFLFHPNAVDGLDQTTRKQVGKRPDNLLDFFVELLEIGIRLVLFDKRTGLFEFVSLFEFTVNDFSIINVSVGDHHRVPHPFAVHL